MRHHKNRSAFVTCLVFLWVLLCSSACFDTANAESLPSAPFRNAVASKNGTVRIALSSLGEISQMTVTTRGVYFADKIGQSILSGSTLTVKINAENGHISFGHNGSTRDMGTSFTLCRGSDMAGLYINEAKEKKNLYPGDLSFSVIRNGGAYRLNSVINVYIEDYLYGVIPYEMGNGSGLEALKAQAVAARTYTVNRMNVCAAQMYDVKDTTADQVYRGTPSGNANCFQAVDATRGIVMTYNDREITAYYSASNGGQTEKLRTGNLPYLSVKDDPYDYASIGASVKRTAVYKNLSDNRNYSALMALFRQKTAAVLTQRGYYTDASQVTLCRLETVFPHTPAYAYPSRLYIKMDFTLTANVGYDFPVLETVTFTCDIFSELESLLSMSLQSARNELWTIAEQSDAFIMEARRYGHGMGISQRGAMQMAKLGYTYDQILGFYYEGCSRMHYEFTKASFSAVGNDTPSSAIGFAFVTAKDAVNLRKGGNLNAPIIGSAPAGACLTVLEQDGTWAKVQYGSIYAYVHMDYISAITANAPEMSENNDLSIEGNPTETPPMISFDEQNPEIAMSSHAAVDLGSTSLNAVVTLESGTLNLRSEPRIGSSVLAYIPNQTVVNVLFSGTEWYLISYNGISGYVMEEFLRFTQDEKDVSVPTENPEQKTNALVSAETSEIPLMATVDVSIGALNLRKEPSLNGMVLTSIPKGTVITAVPGSNGWSCVTYKAQTGYVQSKYLLFGGAAKQTKPVASPRPSEIVVNETCATVYTPSGPLNLRIEPSELSGIIAQIPKGTIIKVIGITGEWCRVRYQNVDGYVKKQFLRMGTDDSKKQVAANNETPDGAFYMDPTLYTLYESLSAFALGGRDEGDCAVYGYCSLSAPLLDVIPRGTVIKVTSMGEEWCGIETADLVGYCPRENLRFGINE